MSPWIRKYTTKFCWGTEYHLGVVLLDLDLFSERTMILNILLTIARTTCDGRNLLEHWKWWTGPLKVRTSTSSSKFRASWKINWTDLLYIQRKSLWLELQKAWDNISVEVLRKYIDTMPERCAAVIDRLQRPTLLSYCCYTRQIMPLSHYTSCSHTVKNTSQSKEKTDSVPTIQIRLLLVWNKVSGLSAFKFGIF